MSATHRGPTWSEMKDEPGFSGGERDWFFPFVISRKMIWFKKNLLAEGCLVFPDVWYDTQPQAAELPWKTVIWEEGAQEILKQWSHSTL